MSSNVSPQPDIAGCINAVRIAAENHGISLEAAVDAVAYEIGLHTSGEAPDVSFTEAASKALSMLAKTPIEVSIPENSGSTNDAVSKMLLGGADGEAFACICSYQRGSRFCIPRLDIPRDKAHCPVVAYSQSLFHCSCRSDSDSSGEICTSHRNNITPAASAKILGSVEPAHIPEIAVKPCKDARVVRDIVRSRLGRYAYHRKVITELIMKGELR